MSMSNEKVEHAALMFGTDKMVEFWDVLSKDVVGGLLHISACRQYQKKKKSFNHMQ